MQPPGLSTLAGQSGRHYTCPFFMDNFENNSETAPEVITVSDLNRSVARLLENSVSRAWIAGEVSNFTRSAPGHLYFTLKDDGAQVRAVMFRGRALSIGFDIKNGDSIEAWSTVTLYQERGDYQLQVESVRLAGVGNLFEAFLRLRERLEKEGLFDPRKKRPLPFFPQTVGIVTSLGAAALQDVLTTISRRTPHVRVILYPTQVQGEGAGRQIADAIHTASVRKEVDVLIVCRGGGSIEDLWSFNEEVVARAISGCTVPVITGVGHETDTTIADFVADLRAPTPTAAAEMLTRSQSDWQNAVSALATGLSAVMERKMAARRQGVDIASRRLISPAAYVRREKIRLDGLANQLSAEKNRIIASKSHSLLHLQTRLKGRLPDTAPYHTKLLTVRRQLSTLTASRMAQLRQKTDSLKEQLELLSPERTLERGYAIITDKKGQIIRSPKKIPVKQSVTVRLAQGSAELVVDSIQLRIE